MEEVQAKVEDTTRDGFAVDQDMLLVQMPATRTDEQDGNLLV